MSTRMVASALLLTSLQTGACSDVASSGSCAELGDAIVRLNSVAAEFEEQTQKPRGPECAPEGGRLSLQLYFDSEALPIEVLGFEYRQQNYLNDSRICGHTDAGDTIEIGRIASQVWVVVSAASYRLPCS